MSENVISLVDLHKAFGDRVILDGVTLGVDRGARVGVIGANGAGKSTLLKIIHGLEDTEAGQVVLRGGQRVFFLEQDPVFEPGATARAILMEPLRPAIDALAQYEKAAAELSDRADALLHEVEQLGAWDWEHRLARAAEEVGLVELDTNVDIFSGGQRKRVALARMILSGAEILLLDEPTNHLDTLASDWLEDWLQKTPATVLLVTHDRYFLDLVVTQMAELRHGKLRIYEGGYTDYLEARTTEEAHRDVTRKRRLQLLKAELEWARRSPKARRTKQKARLGRIDDVKQEHRDLSVEQLAAEFSFGKAPRLGKTILEITSVSKGYVPGPPLIDRLSLIMRKGERFGVVGPNGCGKSTFLKLVAGALEPDSGTINLGRNTKLAWLDQERSILDLSATVKQTIVPDGGEFVFPGGQRLHVVAYLSRFAFEAGSHDMKVSSLSGGERNRLAIARFLLTEANLFLLDEPTNDIDLVTLNVLEAALCEFQGCVLVVSHDRYFLDKICTGIVAFERDWVEGVGQVTVVQGDYTHYRRVRLAELEAGAAEKARQATEARRAEADSRKSSVAKPGQKLTYKEQRELDGIEDRIEAADDEVTRLEQALADPALWADEHARALELDKSLLTARESSAALYTRWEELMAKKDGTDA